MIMSALLPTPAQKDSASYMLGLNFGMMILTNHLGPVNYQEVMAGLKAAAEATGNPNGETFSEQFRIGLGEMSRILDNHYETKPSCLS